MAPDDLVLCDRTISISVIPLFHQKQRRIRTAAFVKLDYFCFVYASREMAGDYSHQFLHARVGLGSTLKPNILMSLSNKPLGNFIGRRVGFCFFFFFFS